MANDETAAILEFDQAIKLNPDFGLAYAGRAFSKGIKGEWDGALADYDKAIGLHVESGPLYLGRANLRHGKRDLVGALADYNKGLALDPSASIGYTGRGRLNFELGNLDAALADFDKSVQLTPDCAECHTFRGVVRKKWGESAAALADFNEAIKLNPKELYAYNARAHLQYDQKEFSKASSDFRKCLMLASGLELDDAQFGIWACRARLGKEAEATEELKEFLKQRKTGGTNDWDLKIGRFLTGELTEAEFLKAARSDDPKENAGQRCEAWFYAATKRLIAGDKVKARDYFQRCVDEKATTEIEFDSARAALNSKL